MRIVDTLRDDRLTIFLFHGVIDRDGYKVRNYTRKHILKERFASIIKALSNSGTGISMDDVIECWENGKTVPKRAFCITFDDGFENNYSIAAPVLESYGVPATFYVTADFIERNTMSWIDRIEHCIERVPSGRLRFSWDNEERFFDDRESKIRVLDYLRDTVKTRAEIGEENAVREFLEQLDCQGVEQSDDPLDLKMNWQQVRALAELPNFLVGGHGLHHVNLASLSQLELTRSITTSLNLLRDRAGIHARHYSYPEGLEHCYTDKVILELKRNGIKCSPSAIEGDNDLSVSLFDLRRRAVI